MTTTLCPNTECEQYNEAVCIESVRDDSSDFLNYACEWCRAEIAEVDVTWADGEGPEPDEV